MTKKDSSERSVLYAIGQEFPVAVFAHRVRSLTEELPPLPPPVASNPGMAFDGAPIDEARLQEVFAFLNGIGFPVQRIECVRSFQEFSMLTITCGQAEDPRTPRP